MKRAIRLCIVLVMLVLSNRVLAVEFPQLNSKIYEVYDLTDGKILYEQDAKQKTDIASLTKIATAITAIETIENLDEEITLNWTVLDTVNREASIAGLRGGDKVTYRELLYAMMIPSGADAAHSIAIFSSGTLDSFVAKMNDLAERIGLTNTHFENVTGFSGTNQYSTADDVRKLLEYALKNPVFKEIYTTKKYTLSTGLEVKSTLYLYQISPQDDQKILGSKTGFLDDLGYCLASLSKANGHEFIIVTIGAEQKEKVFYNVMDNVKAIDFLNENYHEQVVIHQDDVIYKIPVNLSKVEEYEVKAMQDVSKFLPDDYEKSLIRTEYIGEEPLSFKNQLGEKIGKVNYYYENELISSQDVVLNQALPFHVLKFLQKYWWAVVRNHLASFASNE